MKKKILITGINGYIGNSLNKFLLIKGFDVWGIDKKSYNNKTIKINLLNYKETKKCIKSFSSFDVIIHTAAIAHKNSFFKNKKHNTNIIITQNIINSIKNINCHFIFLSSISVYGEDKRKSPVRTKDLLLPSSSYGKSKKKCEEILKNSIKNCDILRLSPVYSSSNLIDIKKRVLIPLISKFKMIIKPSPYYSFCSIDTIKMSILNLITNGKNKFNIYNISDSKLYSQNKLSNYFPNKSFIFYEFIFYIFYIFTYLIPFNIGYKLRCVYWKIFKSNIYKNNYIKIDLKYDLYHILKKYNKL